MPNASAVSRARRRGLEIRRVAPDTSGPTVLAWASPRSVSGASIRPSRRPSALPVDSPWRTRISMTSGTRAGTGSADQDAVTLAAGGELVGGKVADALDLHRGKGQVAAVAPVPHQSGRTHAPEARPQRLVAIGQLLGQPRGQRRPELLLGGDGDPDLRPRPRRWPPRDGRPRRPGRPTTSDPRRAGSRADPPPRGGPAPPPRAGPGAGPAGGPRGPWPGGPGTPRSHRTASSSRSRDGGGRRRRSGPRGPAGARPGRPPGPAPGWPTGPARPDARRTVGQRGPLGKGLDPVPQLVEDRVVLLHRQQRVERLGHHGPLLSLMLVPSGPSPWSEPVRGTPRRRPAYGPRPAPRPARRRRARPPPPR